MKKPRCVTTIDMISEELITEILVRLPVKSILCCKLVSKPWLSLVSDPMFIKSHTKRTLTIPGADKTFIVEQEHDADPISVLHLGSCQIEASLGFPFSTGDYPNFEPDFEILGSYNGVVCVSVTDIPRGPVELVYYCKNLHKLMDPNVYLWNPATKHSKLIPKNIISPPKRNSLMAMGFGIDPVSDDFKVIRITDIYICNEPYFVEVYSANTNAWHAVEPDNLTCIPEHFSFDVCVNGLLCGIGDMDDMMVFDLDKEVFTWGIQFPVKSSRLYANFITDYGDSIAVITFNENSEYHHTFKLWSLDDEACIRGGGVEGVEASWSIRLTFDMEYPLIEVLGCLNSGEFLLHYLVDINVDLCLLYNSDKRESKNVPVSLNFGGRQHRIFKYTESLVSITGSKLVDWNAH